MKKILACLLAFIMLSAPVRAYAFDWPWKKGTGNETTEAVAEAEVLSTTVEEEKEEAITEEPEEAETAEETEVAEPAPLEYDYEELVVGTTMPTYGTFFTSMWGNGSSDIDVRDLIHGYNLVEWDSENSGFILDPSVVSGHVVRETAAGDHTYTITLQNDLRWSDGSRITAYDYAFSYLLRMEPELTRLGATPEDMEYLVGYKNYVADRIAYTADLERNNGNVNAVTREIPRLSGLRVTNDTQMTITISHTMLPFFSELALLDCAPCPISVIAPDCTVRDSATGVYIDGKFTAELLKSTLLGEDGYLTRPTLTCGPYKLVSYEGQEAKFELNEYYKGDANGAKPTIERVIFKQANPETMIDELMAGDYGLLTRTSGAALVQKGMNAIQKDPRYTVANYPRSGMGFIAFNMERPGLDSKEVRQAIAHCIDKDAFVGETVSNFGLRVDGYYGLGQWMYRLLSGTLPYPVEEPENATTAEKSAYERELARWEELAKEMEEFPIYEKDASEAVRLLEKDGWTLNREGDPFDPEKDDVRCKRIDGELEALDLKLVYAKGASVEKSLKDLAEPLAEVGIGLTVESSDKLLDLYYGYEERDYDLIFLATDFKVLYDPSKQFEPEGPSNYYGIDDDELYDLAEDMIRTEPGDLLTYCEKWVDFQERFIELEPIIPIYSNIYFDFYPRVLQNYAIPNYTSWAQAVVPAFMDDIPEEEEVAEEEEDVFND